MQNLLIITQSTFVHRDNEQSLPIQQALMKNRIKKLFCYQVFKASEYVSKTFKES